MIGRAFRSVRRKPKAVRDRYAFWIAAVFTGCVALVWFLQMPARDSATNTVEIHAGDAAAGLEGMFSGFSEQVAAIREEVSQATTTEPKATGSAMIQSQSTSTASTTDAATIDATSSVQATTTAPPSGRPARITTTSASTTAQ